MKKVIFKALKFMYFFCAMFCVLSIKAYAYIDPSATTYIIQAVGAVIIAIGAFITVFRHKIVAFFRKDKTKESKKEIHFEEDENKSE